MLIGPLGYYRKNPNPLDGWDSGNSRGRGAKTLEIQEEGELELEKVFCRGRRNQ